MYRFGLRSLAPSLTHSMRIGVRSCSSGAHDGGGKSDFLLGDYLQDVPAYGAAWRGILLRRTYPELQELVVRSREMYPQTGATWHEADKEWTWPNGAYLRLRYLEREADASRYQGHQYTWIGFDELGQWPSDTAYRQLFACLRSAFDVPVKRVRATGNPGGPGHQWIRARFIDPARTGYRIVRDDLAPWDRMFIPSRVQDNRVLLDADPEYIDRLRGSGSAELVKAWLDGDWDVVAGAFFGEWDASKHVIAPLTIPAHWLRFRSFDWGSAHPFCCLWFAVSDGDLPRIPRGALVVYREWYGQVAGKPNVGLKMTAEEVADGIVSRETGDKIAYGVADPAIFAEDGGPSIAERMMRRGTVWRAADNKRVAARGAMGGWDLVRARLKGIDGKPMLYIYETCRDLIRTLPALQHDTSRPEDLDSDGEDHAADTLRYGLSSRPWTPPIVAVPTPRGPNDYGRGTGAKQAKPRANWKVV